MKRITVATAVSTPIQKVWEQFDEDLFIALKPPFLPLIVDRFDGCKPGDEIHLQVGPFKMKWIGHITEANSSNERYEFIDEGIQLPFPLKKWRHHHIIQQTAAGHSEIIDDVLYSCHNKAQEILIHPFLGLQFALRRPVYQRLFGRP